MPLWLGGGLNHPHFRWIAVAMMATPSIAAVVLAGLEGRITSFTRDVGLWPLAHPRRLIGSVLLAIAVSIFLIVQAAYVGTWLGVFPGDLANFTILNFLAGPSGPAEFLVNQFGLILLGGLLNLLPALGEEIGWRGWLWPRLQQYGQLTKILVSGVIWGLWHAPLILLGYNYPLAKGAWGLLFMCGMCVVVGAFFGWLRTLSGNVWPSAIAHAIFNASAGIISLFMLMGAVLDTQKASILGWSGWILPGLIIGLVLTFTAWRRSATRAISTTGQQSS